MAVHVKWFSTLVKQTRSKQAQYDSGWHEGLTPGEILEQEGFGPADAEAIMVITNGAQCDAETPLRDGDTVEFLVSIQGG